MSKKNFLSIIDTVYHLMKEHNSFTDKMAYQNIITALSNELFEYLNGRNPYLLEFVYDYNFGQDYDNEFLFEYNGIKYKPENSEEYINLIENIRAFEVFTISMVDYFGVIE